MLYYKVLPQASQLKANIRFKNNTLVANELYTANEIKQALLRGESIEFIAKNFEKKAISTKKVFWLFGARFETTNCNNN